MSSANLSSPEVIRAFRQRMQAFQKACMSSLSGHASELSKVRDFLRGEQLSQWKRQLRRREDDYSAARRVFLEAEADVRDAPQRRGPGKQNSTEERLAMDKARRLRDEAEQKLALVQRWILRLDQEGDPLVHSCQGHDLAMRDLVEHALVRLGVMGDRVDAYLSAPMGGDRGPGPTKGPTSTPTLTPTSGAPAPAAAAQEPALPAGSGPQPSVPEASSPIAPSAATPTEPSATPTSSPETTEA